MADNFELSLDDVLDALDDIAVLVPLVAVFRGGLATANIDPDSLKVEFPTALIQDLIDDLTPTGGGGGAVLPPLPGLVRGDPMQPLQRIAEAINAAEALLNQQSLVVAQGSVEVTVAIDVGGAQADAKLHLDIRPREYP